jgi:hypothetical protein
MNDDNSELTFRGCIDVDGRHAKRFIGFVVIDDDIEDDVE